MRTTRGSIGKRRPDDPKDQMVGRDQRRGVHHRRADRDPLLTEDRRPDGVRSLKIARLARDVRVDGRRRTGQTQVSITSWEKCSTSKGSPQMYANVLLSTD